MTKLEGLIVRGYQSHVDSYFPISRGLTIITGPSGGGKTSGVIRPFKWLSTGFPSGEDFLHTLRDPSTGEIRSQAEQTEVIAEMSDGTTVQKIRRKKKTTHWISSLEEPFEKADTPQEVKDILGIHEYNFGDFSTYLNFAYQLDAPFLLSESPSAGAKVLGKLAGTEDVDLAIKAVSKDTHAVRKERDKAEGDIEKYTANLIDYLFLNDAQSALKTCEDLVNLVGQSDQTRSQLMALTATHGKHIAAVNEYTVKLKALDGTEAARHLFDTMDSQIQLFTLLEKYLADYLIQVQRHGAAIDTIKEYEGVEAAHGLLDTLDERLQKLEALKNLSTLSTGYQQVITESDTQLEKVGTLDLAEQSLQLVKSDLETHASLTQLQTKYKNTNGDLQIATALTTKYTNLPGDGSFQVVDDKRSDVMDLKILKGKHEWALRDQQSTTEAVIDAVLDFEIAEKELKDAWISTGGTCPLCEQEIMNL